MDLPTAIERAHEKGRSLARHICAKQPVHTVVICVDYRPFQQQYVPRFAYEVAGDDQRIVWDNITGKVEREESL